MASLAMMTWAMAPATAHAAAQAPRVITLTPHATEMVYAAGGGRFIVGTVSSSDYPKEAQAIPRIGDGIIFNPERIVVLSPTLFVGWLRSGVALQTEGLASELGAQVVYSRPERVRDIPADLLRLGDIMGTAAIAGAKAAELEARIDTLESKYRNKTPVKLFIEVGTAPLYTIGSDPLLNDALSMCSAVNVYAKSGIPAPRVTVESVLVQNPQLLVIAGRHAQENGGSRERWASYGLPAAREGRLHEADPDALFRPGPRFIDAIEALCEAVDAARPGSGTE